MIQYIIINIGNELNYVINKNYRRWLNKRIYSWYVDGDFLLLRYICALILIMNEDTLSFIKLFK